MVARRNRIVIIDDDPDIRDLLTTFLKGKNYTVTTFNDAEAAYEKLYAGFLADAIVTDLNLPGMTGIQFVQKLKNAGIEIPVLLLTVTQELEVAMDAVSSGAFDFIIKPIHFPQFQIAIERALYLYKLTQENSDLRTMLKNQQNPSSNGIVGKSPGFLQTLDLAQRVSKSIANVLINGESGTGKEVIAKLIHSSGPRKNGPFVAINCSAIPEALLETELFGHARGAFTGAQAQKIGLFEEAHGGTILLDEIGDLSLPLQAKLLRVLQERQIKRLGENQDRPIDVRVISATHKSLPEEVAQKRFREDLFFRLNVVPIRIPPLRERKEDIIPLAEVFLKKFALLNASPVKGYSKDALQCLLENPWKGNVRELENTIERAVVLCTGTEIQKSDLLFESLAQSVLQSNGSASFQEFPSGPDGKPLPLNDIVQRYIQYVLDRNAGLKDKTAKELEIDRKTLYRRVQAMGRVN